MDVVLPSGTLAVLCPLPRKLVVSPWEVKGLLYSCLIHRTPRVCFSVPGATLQKRYMRTNQFRGKLPGCVRTGPSIYLSVQQIEWTVSHEEQVKELLTFL